MYNNFEIYIWKITEKYIIQYNFFEGKLVLNLNK